MHHHINYNHHGFNIPYLQDKTGVEFYFTIMTDKKKFWVRQKAETSLYVESKALTESDKPTTEPESEPEAESEPEVESEPNSKPETNDNPVDEAVKEAGNKFVIRIYIRI